MRKYKYFILLTLISIFILNICLPVKFVYAQSKKSDEIDTISYTDEENLKKYGFPPKNKLANSSIISPGYENSMVLSLPNDNPDSLIIVEPIYRTYTNKDLKLIADIIVSFILGKIKYIEKYFLLDFFVSNMTNFSDNINPTYVGSWVWETHDYKAGHHVRYATVVHYSDSTYSTPIGVEMIEVDRYPIEYHKSSPGEWVYYYPNYYWYEYGIPVKSEWRQVNGGWYYLQSNGVMATGWLQINGYWYYFDTIYGYMKTGWQQINGAWYYFWGGGSMATRWLEDNGYWYYLDATHGYMKTSWQQIDGKWYYFYSSGKMAVSTVIDGYRIGSDGVANR